jgi:hypothetical protein
MSALHARVNQRDNSAGFSSAYQPRLSFCARRLPTDDTLWPLTGVMDQPLSHCFSSIETSPTEPLVMYLFETQQQPSLVELVPASCFGAEQNKIQFSEDEATYTHNLLVGGKENELLNRRIIDEMSSTVCSHFNLIIKFLSNLTNLV